MSPETPAPPPLPILSYAGPQFDPREPVAWPNGPYLVVCKGASLPDRCVKCNAAAGGGTMRKRVYWANTSSQSAGGGLRMVPFVRIFFAFASLIQWLYDLRTFQTLVVEVGICRKHRTNCHLRTLLAFLGLPLGILIAYVIRDREISFWSLWAAVIGFAASAIAWRSARPVAAVHVGTTHVTLRGVGLAYLQSLTPPSAPARTATAGGELLDSIADLKARVLKAKQDSKA